MPEQDNNLDVCGLCCPMPLISISKSVSLLEPGNTLKILGDDPIFEQGVRDFCEMNKHEFISIQSQGGRVIEIVIKIIGTEE